MVSKADKQEFLLRAVVLSFVFAIAFFTRLFSVLRFESVIHEFDPYFNYRCTQYLVNEGFYNFINWFDETAWYPLGRIVGGTVYPGLMLTAGAVYWVLHFFNITVQIRNVCVLLAPFMASNTAMVTYLITKETWNTAAGVTAAFFVAVVPGYISRSVAGSYDNEGIAIFALIATYYFWIKALKTGSTFWAGMCALFYFYMVAAWGGYVFIINLIPLHVLMLLLSGRYSPRLYVSYSSFYILGTLLSMQIRFVGFQPVQSGEHMAAFGMFGLLQLYAFVQWAQQLLSPTAFQAAYRLVLLSALTVFAMAEATIEASVFLAAKGGYVDDLTELSNAPHNASFAVQDSLGNTPLHYAAGGNHAAAVEFIASTGVDLNAKNRIGDTPLHKAATRGAEQACEKLLVLEADLKATNNDGELPYQCAKTAVIKNLLFPSEEDYDSEGDEQYYNEEDEAASDSD